MYFPALIFALSGLLPSPNQDFPRILRGPYLQEVTQDGATVVWHTNRPQPGILRYGETMPDKAVASSGEGLVLGTAYQHAVRLKGLRQGTAYRYWVDFPRPGKASDSNSSQGSAEGRFTTLSTDPSPFRFVVSQDVHGKAPDYEANLRLADAGGARFVALLGDGVTDPDTAQAVFDGFLDPSVRVFAPSVPLVFVHGNHERHGRFAGQLPALFPHTSGRTYFSFHHAGVHFMVLDTGDDEAGTTPGDALAPTPSGKLREEQARWLEQELKSPSATQARFRIAMMHIPPYGFPTMGDPRMAAASDVWDKWSAILKEGKVDLVLAGHIHRKHWISAGTGPYPFSMFVGPFSGTQEVLVDADRIRIRPLGRNGQAEPEVVVPRRKDL